jgi:ligand-binding sensor domain-containing protein
MSEAMRQLGPGWSSYTSANDVYDLTFDYDGNLWTVAVGSRIVKWNLTDGTYVEYTIADGLARKWIRSVAVASDGALWFGTDVGVARFDGETWTTYTTEDGLASQRGYRHRVTSIAVAHDGALWFGTWGGGVSRFDGETWTTYSVEDGLASNRVLSIAVAHDGALWFGTEGGAFSEGGASRFDGETWTTYTTEDGLGSNQVLAIAVAPDGALWFGSGVGPSRFDGESWTTYTSELGRIVYVVIGHIV